MSYDERTFRHSTLGVWYSNIRRTVTITMYGPWTVSCVYADGGCERVEKYMGRSHERGGGVGMVVVVATVLKGRMRARMRGNRERAIRTCKRGKDT